MSQPTYLYGLHVANILLENHAENIITIYLQDSFVKVNNPKINQIVNLANQYGIKIQYFAKQKLDQFALSQQHQGVVVQCKGNTVLKAKNDDQLKAYHEELLEQDSAHKFFILILDGIQDPHNLGACIRSAAAMGVDCVILPQNNSVGITSTVCKTSAGTALTLPIFQVVNLARTIESGAVSMKSCSTLSRKRITSSTKVGWLFHSSKYSRFSELRQHTAVRLPPR